ncbi:MAG TPA: VCBS repeat-containing protein, partial [Candidatus Eisenbacteria bacterium]
IHAEPRRPAWNETLAILDTGAEPETTWEVRVEALGMDGVIASRERRVRIDHSPPVITELHSTPVLSVDPVTDAVGYGLRVSAKSDEPVFGRLNVTPDGVGLPPIESVPPPRFERMLSSAEPILGLDQPLAPGNWTAHASYRNDAGRSTERTTSVSIPAASVDRPVRSVAPDAATYLPRLVDIDGDGQPELVGESRLRTGPFYGNLRAWRPRGGGIPFEEVWRSDERGIPRDAGDFDGDGRTDLLVLSLQKATVYSARISGGFPTFKLAEINDGWAALFIPAASGTGLDVVTSFNTSIRIFRREAGGVVLDQELMQTGNGINTISPGIVKLKDSGDGLGLATVDGDGDLLIARRGGDGRFTWQQTIRLGPDYLPGIAAADLDGDGTSEIAVVEAVGEVPSPTAGLRDGYYRLRILRPGEDGDYHPWQELGVTGQFPGNAVHLDGGIPRTRSGEGECVWATLNGRAWRLALDEGQLAVDTLVDDVGDGPLAWGLVGEGLDTQAWTIFPTRPGVSPPDDDLVSATLVGRFPSVPFHPMSPLLGLEATFVGRSLSGEQIRLAWSGGEVTSVVRIPQSLDLPESPWSRTLPPGATSIVDSTAIAGHRYFYRLSAPDGSPLATLDVTASPSNPVVDSSWDGRRLIVRWTHPIRPRESARLVVLPDG